MTRIALAQVAVQASPNDNLNVAQQYFDQAAASKAALIVFPETFMALSPPSMPNRERSDLAEPLSGPFVAHMKDWARQHHIWVAFGIFERPTQPDPQLRVYNTVVVVDNRGEVVGSYRKTHLYDAFGFQESAMFLAGEKLWSPLDTPFGRLGLMVCYELRFPEIARSLALDGSEIILVPSAWYGGSLKEFHWQLLIQARALENTVYIAGCNQAGNGFTGRSLVCDPLGLPIAQASETTSFLTVDLDLDRIASARHRLPCVAQRRPTLYPVS